MQKRKRLKRKNLKNLKIASHLLLFQKYLIEAQPPKFTKFLGTGDQKQKLHH